MPSNPIPAAASSHDDPDTGCAEALLAGALALMTGHAQACCDTHRETIARKVAVRLQALSQHEAFSPHFHTAVGNLQSLWIRQGGLGGLVAAGSASQPAERSAARDRRELWHVTHDAVQ